MAFIGNTNTTQAFTPAIDYFSGTGSATAFTLSRPVASVAQVQVTIDNVAQNPSSAYTISGSTITFTSAPLSGTNNIYVYYTSPITQVIAPGQGTVTSDSFGAITNFTTTGNTILGDASTDTLNVGNGGLVKDASGNVGIGTSSPGTKLTVSTGVAGNLAYFTDAINADFYIKTASSIATIGPNAGSTNFAFQTSGTERARIDSSGNLLVGTTSAVGKLTVFDANNRSESTSQFSITGSGYAGYHFLDGTAYYIGQNSNSRELRIYSGSSTAVGVRLTAGNNAWQTYSDERMKDIIEPIENAAQKVSTLRTVIGKYKTDAIDKRRVFMIAQDVQAVLPEAVTTDAEGMLGMAYDHIVPLLTAAIKEQQALITSLTARITALETR